MAQPRPLIDIIILPREEMSWPEFCTRTPHWSIALDGFVPAAPMKNLQTGHFNFDHHVDVDRLATRSTTAQIYMAIQQGLLDFAASKGVRHIYVYANDCDNDVIGALWLLKNAHRIRESKVQSLVTLIDTMDTTGGAFVLEERPLGALCWMFEPYSKARQSGALLSADRKDMMAIIDAVHTRMDAHLAHQGQRLTPDLRYQTLYRGEGWHLVWEVGDQARVAMRRDGITGFVAWRGAQGKGQAYSIGRTGISDFPVKDLLQHLSQFEGAGFGKWGGGDTIGGSHRETGSSLDPIDLAHIINHAIAPKRPQVTQARLPKYEP